MKSVFVIMIAVFTALAAYVAVRGSQVFRDIPIARNTYLVATVLMYVFLIGGMIIGMFSTAPIAKTIAFIGHTSLVVFLYLIISFLLVDIVRLTNYFVHFAPEGMFVFRKAAFAASIFIIAITLFIGNYKFNHPKIVNIELSLHDKPAQNKELRIVAASDIHLGVSIDKKRLQKYVKLINEQHPDIVLLAGDIFDNVPAPVIKQNMNGDLRKIEAPLGVYAVPGNHEYIGRDIEKAVEYLQSANIHVLRDSVALIDDDFYLVGRDDRMNHNRKTLSQLMLEIDRSKPVIMLDHQPYHLEEAEAAGVDLQLSGHTHYGQVWPVTWITRSMYEHAYGYLEKGDTKYWISSGLGIWGGKFRIGSRSEYVVAKIFSTME